MKNFMKIFPKIFTKRQAEEGLTIYDVLMAMIISFIFLMVTLQLTVASAVIRVKAKEKSEAINWIREDSDYLKYLASKLDCITTPGYNDYAEDLINQLADSGLDEYQQSQFPKTTLTLGPNSSRTYTFNRILDPDPSDPDPSGNILRVTYYVDFNGDTKTCNPTVDEIDSGQSFWDECVTVVDMEITPNAVFGSGCS